jgi:SAM-dependent methyltransferase
MWDERYSKADYLYGKEPNDFLVSMLPGEKKGRALCLAEGEGRNAVFLAKCGHEVLAVDLSKVGLEKAKRLADASNVKIQTLAARLEEYEFALSEWDLIIAIWAHVPVSVREQMHRGVQSGLRIGGRYIFEAYHPDNIGRGTGGPQDPTLCVRADDLRRELSSLEVLHLAELEREVNEGTLHKGLAAVTQGAFLKVAE